MAQAVLDAKAEDVVIRDLRKLSSSFDFFVISSATSGRHSQSLTDRIEEEMERRGVRLWHREGGEAPRATREGDSLKGGWILLDYGPVVGHIFVPEVRRFYDLERLWADAPRLRLPKKKSDDSHRAH
jgi:ribosome-associated protein